MSRVIKRMDPSMLVEDSTLEIIPHWRPLKETLDIVLLSTLCRGQYLGGSRESQRREHSLVPRLDRLGARP